jgi:cytochrome c-type biogenesis protein CcmH/NrfG
MESKTMISIIKNLAMAAVVAGTLVIGQTNIMANNDGAIASSSQIHLIQGSDMLNAGKLDNAIESLMLALSHNPSSAEANTLMGNAYSLKGEFELAIQSYRSALQIEPNNVEALKQMAAAHYMTENYNAAVGFLNRAISISPNNFESLALLAMTQCKLGKYTEAADTFVQAEGKFSGSLSMAAELENAGKYMEAIKYYEMAHQIDPSSKAASKGLARVYQISKTEEVVSASMINR